MDILNLFNTDAMICMLIFSVEISFGLSEMSNRFSTEIPIIIEVLHYKFTSPVSYNPKFTSLAQTIPFIILDHV